MLKSVKLFSLLIALFAISACSSGGEDKYIYANKIIVKQAVIEKVVGDEFQLNNQIVELNPYNAKIHSVSVVSGDETIASYNKTNNAVKALSEGKAVIKITAISNDVDGVKTYISEDITLIVTPKPVYVSEILFDSEIVSINIDEDYSYN